MGRRMYGHRYPTDVSEPITAPPPSVRNRAPRNRSAWKSDRGRFKDTVLYMVPISICEGDVVAADAVASVTVWSGL